MYKSTTKMNCSAFSISRAVTNGCALNSAFLATAPNNTKGLLVTNTNNISSSMNTISSNQPNLTLRNSVRNNSNGTRITECQKCSKLPEEAAKILQQSNVVCFDVDSTVIREEGIDELAEFCGKGSEVARVTKEAMGGAMTFQDALNIRLNIIRPTQQQITEFILQRPATLTRNVKRLIAELKMQGKHVYLISGGFDCLIKPVAAELGIPLTNLYANKLLFNSNGEYVGFDITQPTSHSGGKAEAVAIIKRQHAPNDLITMIGDGATDMEAVPPANHFIGFGGNVIRAEVFKRAQYYITDFSQVMSNECI